MGSPPASWTHFTLRRIGPQREVRPRTGPRPLDAPARGPHNRGLPQPGPRMTPHQFVARWQAADLSERAACQSHFADLCAVLGQPKPTDVDPTGSWYAFEKGVDTA